MNTRMDNKARRDEVHAEVRRRFPGIVPMRDAYVYQIHRGWEFTGPRDFVILVDAEDCYDARAKGWQAWLDSKPWKGTGGEQDFG